jgi:hypothetical protein
MTTLSKLTPLCHKNFSGFLELQVMNWPVSSLDKRTETTAITNRLMRLISSMTSKTMSLSTKTLESDLFQVSLEFTKMMTKLVNMRLVTKTNETGT